MLASLFLKGSIIGFSIAMPVGPVGILCIQHSLNRGIKAGLTAGLGAAMAEAFFGCMAGFGFSLLSQALIHYQIWWQITGTLMLWVLGIKIFHSTPPRLEELHASFSHKRVFLSTFALTLANPITFFCFTALYANLGVAPDEQDFLPAAILMLGILAGGALWWTSLTCGVSFVIKKFNLHFFSLFNRVVGTILASCGCLATLALVRQFLFAA